MSLIHDLITRVRNASMARKEEFVTPFSIMCSSFLAILVNEGFISGFRESTKNGKRFLVVSMKYYENQPVIKEIKAVTKPGRRIYVGYKELEVLNTRHSGAAVNVISTSHGLLSDGEAVLKKVGGEFICRII